MQYTSSPAALISLPFVAASSCNVASTRAAAAVDVYVHTCRPTASRKAATAVDAYLHLASSQRAATAAVRPGRPAAPAHAPLLTRLFTWAPLYLRASRAAY